MKTITPEYATLNQQLHDTCAFYGCNSHQHEPIVWRLMVEHGCNSVLDYGCGKGAFVRCMAERHTGIPCQGYDPGHPEYLDLPKPADMVVCTDVMEHIEPELVINVLREIKMLSYKAVFFVIALRLDSSKLLPDNTNPHKVVQGVDDWLADFNEAWTRKGWESTIHDYAPDKQITLSVKWV